MRHLLSLGILASTTGAALAEPPTDVEVFNCIRRIQMTYAEMEANDFREAKQRYRAIIAETARGLDLTELTPYQAVLIGPILDSGGLDETQERSLTDALERASADPEQGAAALLLLHSMRYWEDPERTYLGRFFEHPHIEATMNGWFAHRAINSFSLEPDQLRRFAEDIERAVLSIDPNGFSDAPSRASVSRLLEALDHPDVAAEVRSRRTRIHGHLLKVARSISWSTWRDRRHARSSSAIRLRRSRSSGSAGPTRRSRACPICGARW
jgi:hypothetical protein